MELSSDEAKSGRSSPSSSQDSQDDEYFVQPDTQPVYTSHFMQQCPNNKHSENNEINAEGNILKRRYSSQSTSSSTQDEETGEPVSKTILENYSTKAMRLMYSMGYDPQKGLGKTGQGRLEPVEASTQEGRRGFGLKLDGLDAAALKWSPEMEQITIPESMDWLNNEDTDLYDITMQDLAEWVVIGKKKMTIDDETKFCSPEILKNVLSSKTVFDNLGDEMRLARNRGNPFEKIKCGIFLNRAAMKMANMDSLCGFMFTRPVDQQGKSLIKENDLLYFADVCAGPGGFSEYVLYRKGWESKGFGFTLKGDNDFKLEKFHAGPPETFNPYYGVTEDGNIFIPKNITAFTNFVLKQTDNGVHFVMADGGFNVKGQENIQEILSKQLYLCQCLVALSILREKGHFVVKLFDLFTPFSVGLVYLMYKCFDKICICKPNTSRPANSERYLICKWKKDHTDTIRRHLFHINEEIEANKDSNIDTVELVRHEILMQDEKFVKYITDSNNRIGENQIIGLLKVAAYCNDTNLEEKRQIEIRDECLKLWEIPDKTRREPEKVSCEVLLNDLLRKACIDPTVVTKQPLDLQSENHLKKNFISLYNWHFVAIGREETNVNMRALFLCKGGRDVYILTSSGGWRELPENPFEITPKSLFFGEIVTERIGEHRSQRQSHALHIIDGVVLGGTVISGYPLAERMKLCDKFARALNKPFAVSVDSKPVAPIRAKKLFSLTELQSFFNLMKHYKLKDGNERLGLRIRTEDEIGERFFVPGGLMFFNEFKPPLTCHLSKRRNLYYCFDPNKGTSVFIQDVKPGDVYAPFEACYGSRLMWKWVNVRQVDEHLDKSQKEDDILYRTDFYEYVHTTLMK